MFGLCTTGYYAGSKVNVGDSADIHVVMEGKGVCAHDGAGEAS